MKIEKYSLGIGDRFAHQGVAQLKAIINAKKNGINITPVWNKSNREHSIIHTSPIDTRLAADYAIKELNWEAQYFVDADHINMSNVDKFIDSSDFFTIDVANYIGKETNKKFIQQFINRNLKYTNKLSVPGILKPIEISEHQLELIASKYLYAATEAGKIYHHIEKIKGADNFVTEVSMDEVNDPQTPIEFFFILSMLAAENIPLQTIAPRFSGRFNKGVDYVGDVSIFEKEFEEYLLVIDHAVKEFKLPENLKLSVHSGSDKFSIYPVIKKLIKKYDKGIHVKTAGTTWLEEVIGLAMAGNEALDLAKTIYSEALSREDELCKPYATVIDIDYQKLPSSEEIRDWDSKKFADTLRHIPGHSDYNPHFRQLIHVGYKIAVEYNNEFIACLNKYSDIIGKQVTENLYDRHIRRLFDITE